MVAGDTRTPVATTASVDRRVERLEEKVNSLQEGYNEMNRKIDRVELNQQHIKEVLDARLQSTGSKIDTLHSKLDGLVLAFNDFKLNLVINSGDVEATPAGREVAKEIKELKEHRGEIVGKIDNLEKKMIFISGGLAVIVFIINIIAPAIRGWLGF